MSASKISLISAALKLLISNATGWEKVHEGQKILLDWKDFLDQFKDSDGEIQGATLGYGPLNEEFLSTQQNELQHGFIVRCIQGAEFDTERLFKVQCEAICQQLRDITLSSIIEQVLGIEMTEIQSRIIGGVLCHYTEIRFTTVERVYRNETPPTWTQLIVWHIYKALAAADGGGLFNVRADLTTDNPMAAAAFRMEFPDWLSHGSFEAGMMIDPADDGTTTLARTGRLWVDATVGVTAADLYIVGMKDEREIPSDDQDTGIDHTMEKTDTSWVKTVYTPDNLSGTETAESPPDPDGGGGA